VVSFAPLLLLSPNLAAVGHRFLLQDQVPLPCSQLNLGSNQSPAAVVAAQQQPPYFKRLQSMSVRLQKRKARSPQTAHLNLTSTCMVFQQLPQWCPPPGGVKKRVWEPKKSPLDFFHLHF
jgi:hypothetical protein